MTRRIGLSVNDETIEMDYFVQGFLDHTVVGMVSSLEGVGDIDEAAISVEGENTAVWVNGKPLTLNDFAATIVATTVRGMVSALKGVEGAEEKIRVAVQR